MRRRQANSLAVPFGLLNPFRVGAGPRPVSVAVVEVGDGYLCVEYQMGIAQVVLFRVKKDEIGWRYTLLAEPLEPIVEELKSRALSKCATLEAIQLLGQLTPLTKAEEVEMSKLTKKTGDKAALKDAAKKTPVGGKKAVAPAAPAKRRGNPEALAAARAAKNTGPDNRKITVVKKDHGARAGSKRADLLESIFKAKTVQAAVDAGVSKSDVSWAAREGYISLA